MATSISQPTPPRVACPVCLESFTRQGIKLHMTRMHPSHQAATQLFNYSEFFRTLSHLKMHSKTLKRIPKGARISAAEALSSCINDCLVSDSIVLWSRILAFSYKSLNIPKKVANGPSLTSSVKQNINMEWSVFNWNPTINHRQAKHSNPENTYAKQAITKLEDRDRSGAVRILSSDEAFAPFDSSTLKSLRGKHPTANSSVDLINSISDLNSPSFQTNEKDVFKAIFSFLSGSAGGLDDLRPQYLKDMLSSQNGAAGAKLLKSVTDLVDLMLRGAIPLALCPILYGANLCALKKKDGGIRPIASGNAFRRLASKICNSMLISKTTSFLLPYQYGVGIKGGAETVVHSLRAFINDNILSNFSILKIDFKNAFNMIHRERILSVIAESYPEAYPYVFQAYGSPSCLAYGEDCILSQRGVQQRDPSSFFSIIIQPLISFLSSPFNAWYLNDSTLGGLPDVV